MNRSSSERIGMAAGIGYFVANLVSLPLKGDLPAADAPTDQIVAYYTGQAVGIGLYGALGLVGVAFLVWFLGYLRAALSRSAGPQVAATAFAAGTLLAITTMGSIAAYAPASFVVDVSELEEASLRALHGVTFLSDGFFAVSVTAKGILLISVAVASLARRFVPRWLGWLGVIVGAGCLLGTFSFTEGGQGGPLTGVFFASSIAASFSILVISIALTIKPSGFGQAAEPPGLP